jgi:hypothetical protein
MTSGARLSSIVAAALLAGRAFAGLSHKSIELVEVK